MTVEQYKRENKGKELPEFSGYKQIVQAQTKGIKETDEGLQIDFVISTSSVDRDQDTIAVTGWEMENYRKNPVVLWAHRRYDPPVAKSIADWVDGEALKSTALFPTKDTYRFGHMIGEMYKGGFLNAVSVGFKSLEARWAADEETRPWGIDYSKQELLEYSCCPVPANPEALVDAKDSGIDVADYYDMVIRCLDTGDSLIPTETAEKLYQVLRTKSAFFMPAQPKAEERAPIDKAQRVIQINQNRRKCYEV